MGNARRLLILDDDASVAMTIAAIADGIGFTVRSCSDPDDFFDAVEGWRPSHIAVDLVMPTLDGMEVLRLLAERRCRAQVIVTSGMGTKVLESAQRSAAERGLSISGILPKPFRAQQLRSLLLQSSAGVDAPVPASAPPPAFAVDEIALGLRQAQFILHFQPKIDLATGRAIGFEALVRWQHPQHGLIPPDAFIPVLERAGEISQLTVWVVQRALAWLAGAPAALSVSINLSARDLSDLSLADWLARSCRDAGVAPDRLVLELTETSAMQDPTLALDVLTRLRIKGFRLGIDDFGTGYSSMVQLSRLPFSELKVDKSFVMSMHRSEESRKIVASTISLGRSLGLTTVAEGIENAETAALLRELGCEQGQGYHFGRPMSAEAVRGWLAR